MKTQGGFSGLSSEVLEFTTEGTERQESESLVSISYPSVARASRL